MITKRDCISRGSYFCEKYMTNMPIVFKVMIDLELRSAYGGPLQLGFVLVLIMLENYTAQCS